MGENYMMASREKEGGFKKQEIHVAVDGACFMLNKHHLRSQREYQECTQSKTEMQICGFNSTIIPSLLSQQPPSTPALLSLTLRVQCIHVVLFVVSRMLLPTGGIPSAVKCAHRETTRTENRLIDQVNNTQTYILSINKRTNI